MPRHLVPPRTRPPGSHTLTFTHTTTATANRLLLVGVSMNITAVSGTGVVGVTYNGTALTLVGSHNDAGNTRRVEMWYLQAPLNGGPFNVVVTVNLPIAGDCRRGGRCNHVHRSGSDRTARDIRFRRRSEWWQLTTGRAERD